MARSPIPYGYRLVPDPSEQRIISFVRDGRAGEPLSLGALSRILASNGILSRSRKPFTRTQLARMLTDRADAAER
jgi:hypothetical protein